MYGYSQRLPRILSINPLTRLIAEKRSRGVRFLDLTVSNPTETLEDYPHEAIRRTCGAISDFTYRPDPLGEEEARRAIGAMYSRAGIAMPPERLALTASSSESYALLFKLFCDPGDEILVPVPSYPLFELLARLEGVRVVPYPLLYEGAWFLDFATLRERISEKTRTLVVVNPNNPTGSFLKRHELEELLEIAETRRLPLICDEVFRDYEVGGAGDRVTTLMGCDAVLSFSLDGLSKSAGMPQMKLGWIAMNGPEPMVATARERLELVLDTYLSVATPVQRALTELLEIGAGMRSQIATRVRQNLSILDSILEHQPAHRLSIEGGWSAVIQLPNTRSEEMWLQQLVEDGVLVQPGYFFDFPAEPYIVVSLITKTAVFEEGMWRVAAALSTD